MYLTCSLPRSSLVTYLRAARWASVPRSHACHMAATAATPSGSACPQSRGSATALPSARPTNESGASRQAINNLKGIALHIRLGTTRARDFAGRYVLESAPQGTVGDGSTSRWTVLSFPSTLEFALAALGEAEIRRRTQGSVSLESVLTEVRGLRDDIVSLGGV